MITNGHSISLSGDENIQNLDCGDDCTSLGIY